jgi:hypothetical protein
MRFLILALLVVLPLAAEGSKSEKPASGPPPAAQAAGAPPAGANKSAARQTPAPAKATKEAVPSPVPANSGTVVVQTPFGPTLRAAPDGNAPAPASPGLLADDPMLKIEESGDTVIFRRRTPFGDQVWRRKRSELSDMEREAVEARSKTGLPRPAAPPAASDHR